MRALLSALAVLIALAPVIEAFAGPSHIGCGSAPEHAMHDAGAEAHAAHHAAVERPAALPDTAGSCDCGCDCGAGHGCTAAATAVPAQYDPIILSANALVPIAFGRALSSRRETPLYRPPIS